MRDLGVDIKTNMRMGEDFSLEDIWRSARRQLSANSSLWRKAHSRIPLFRNPSVRE
jgi:hypothetical protein